MSESSLIITGVLIALCVVNILVVLRVRANHMRNRKIAQLLDRIRLASEETRAHLMAKSTLDLSGDFETLQRIAPAAVKASVRALSDTYTEIQRRTEDFQEQDSMTTLQSSVATLKTDKLVNQIHHLSRQIEIQLGDPNHKLPPKVD